LVPEEFARRRAFVEDLALHIDQRDRIGAVFRSGAESHGRMVPLIYLEFS
jgi:hypothetical protein